MKLFCDVLVLQLYLLVDEVDGASRVNVHKVNFDVVVDEFCAPRHGVREAALHLETQTRPQKCYHQTLPFFPENMCCQGLYGQFIILQPE